MRKIFNQEINENTRADGESECEIVLIVCSQDGWYESKDAG